MATGLKSGVEDKGKRPANNGGTTCPVCGSNEPWGMASWCPNCGYYPALMKSPTVQRRVAEAAAAPQEQKFELKDAVPAWAVMLGVGVLFVILFSFVFSFMLPEEGPERAFFALGQSLLGLFVAVTGHLSAFMYAASKTDKFSPLDVMMKPIEIWKPTASALPKAAWRFWVAAWGMTAILSGIFIVGGLSYEALFEDWGVDKRASVNVVQEVVKQARREREGGAESLEDAMNDFVGEEEKEDINKLPSVDCLIVGYMIDVKGEFDSILVASVVGTELSYVARIPAEDIPEVSRDRLVGRMKNYHRRAPFVKIQEKVAADDETLHWLDPVLMCQVAYKEWDKSNRLMKPRFKRVLADVDEKGVSN